MAYRKTLSLCEKEVWLSHQNPHGGVESSSKFAWQCGYPTKTCCEISAAQRIGPLKPCVPEAVEGDLWERPPLHGEVGLPRGGGNGGGNHREWLQGWGTCRRHLDTDAGSQAHPVYGLLYSLAVEEEGGTMADTGMSRKSHSLVSGCG